VIRTLFCATRDCGRIALQEHGYCAKCLMGQSAAGWLFLIACALFAFCAVADQMNRQKPVPPPRVRLSWSSR